MLDDDLLFRSQMEGHRRELEGRNQSYLRSRDQGRSGMLPWDLRALLDKGDVGDFRFLKIFTHIA